MGIGDWGLGIGDCSINTSVNNFNERTNVPKKLKKEKDFLSKEMKIKGYLDCFLKPVKFSLIKVYNESCPIDLIPFNEIDEVSVTKCLHAFHYNCIKNYCVYIIFYGIVIFTCFSWK